MSSLRQANAHLLVVQERGPTAAHRRQWYNGTSRDSMTNSYKLINGVSPSTELRSILIL